MGFVSDWVDEVDRANAVKEDREAELTRLLNAVTPWYPGLYVVESLYKIALMMDEGKLTKDGRASLARSLYESADRYEPVLAWLEKYAPEEHRVLLGS